MMLKNMNQKKILKNKKNNQERNNIKYPYNFNYIYYIKITRIYNQIKLSY